MSPFTVTVLAYVGIFASALCVILTILLLWRRREVRRYEAVDVASTLKAWGLEDTFGKLFLAYAVGNYFGKDSVIRTSREMIAFINDKGVPGAMKSMFKKLFLHFIKDEDELKWMQGEIAKVAGVPAKAAKSKTE